MALAKKSLKAAEADRAALEARIAADVARYSSPPRADAAGAGPRRRPARSEDAHCSQAEEALLKAEIADLEAKNAAKAARQIQDKRRQTRRRRSRTRARPSPPRESR